MKSIILVFVVTVLFLVGMTKFNNTTNYNEAIKYMELSQYYNEIQGGNNNGGNNNVFLETVELEVSLSGAVNSIDPIKVQYGCFLSQAISQMGGLKNNADPRCYNGNFVILENYSFYIPTGMGLDKISINTAKKEELMMLNNVGAITAGRIIEYREAHGFFQTLESVMEVEGIGTQTYYNIRDNIIL